jgi:methionyl-tRNA formyltransferase
MDPSGIRVLFLGSNYNSISIACLDALVAEPGVEVIVGFRSPRRGILAESRRAWSRYGARFVARRWIDRALSTGQLWLRKAHLAPSGYRSLRELVLVHRLERFEFRSVNSAEAVDRLRTLRPDVIAVAAFNQILEPAVIRAASRACINAHPSLLPRYRGPYPLYWVLRNREARTGVTIHHVDEGIDSGDIILQQEIALEPGTTESSLRDRSGQVAAGLLAEAIRLARCGTLPRIEQDEAGATYHPLPPRGAPRL